MVDLSPFQNPRFARAYERFSVRSDAYGTAAHRARALAGLRGRVIEIGAGNGRNFAHYPATVTEVVAVEPENLLRARADRAAQTAPVPVTMVAAHAENVPDGPFDAAVFSLVLCSVPSQTRALAEAYRVLRPGGELRFFEHVRSPHRAFALLEDLITPLWARLNAGCHPNHDTAAHIRAAGFTIADLDRFAYRPVPTLPRLSHILGRAHRP